MNESTIDMIADLRSRKQHALARYRILKEIENPDSVEILYRDWFEILDKRLEFYEKKFGGGE